MQYTLLLYLRGVLKYITVSKPETLGHPIILNYGANVWDIMTTRVQIHRRRE